jgi:molybdopterin biosynthesis enzyme
LAALDALAKPVAARDVDVAAAFGRTLAADVAASARPARGIALRDGWAVKADEIADAGGYAPVRLAKVPARVETGDELPAGADAVAPLDFITLRGNRAEAVSAVTPGDGVLPAGAETDPAKPLRKAGERIRAIDAVVFLAADIARVKVRAPKILIAAAREDLRLVPAVQLIARDCQASGSEPLVQSGGDLERALRDEKFDALVIVGGTGSGSRDQSVQALARAGRVAFHGVGLTPGETAALGSVGARPVLIVPGRLDAALAVWLTLGRRLLARLSGHDEDEPAISLTLSRKLTSTVGLAEFVPVRRSGDTVEPLAARYLPLAALARADGWLLVPADSEGYAAGAKVAVKTW